MIMKVLISSEDKLTEVFEISNYYAEEDFYIEAALGKNGDMGKREIILEDGNYMGEMDNWKEITIMTDTGMELIKFKNNGGK